jgi:prepilin-type N-terminal cleavage/methylation domain-containing protein
MLMIKIKAKNKRGFSFLEVMISIFLLSVGLIALVGAVSKSLALSMEARNQVIAAQLAQEGLELAINVHDTRKLNGENYDFVNYLHNGNANVIEVPNTNTHGGGSIFDYRNPIDPIAPDPYHCHAQNVGENCDFYLKYDKDNGYQYEYGDETIFKRYIINWYGGAGGSGCGGGYCSLGTCSNSIFSIVIWQNGFWPSSDGDCTLANKCAMALASVETEKDPNNPKCRGIDIYGGPSSITYP